MLRDLGSEVNVSRGLIYHVYKTVTDRSPLIYSSCTRPDLSLARNEMAIQISGLTISVVTVLNSSIHLVRSQFNACYICDIHKSIGKSLTTSNKHSFSHNGKFLNMESTIIFVLLIHIPLYFPPLL